MKKESFGVDYFGKVIYKIERVVPPAQCVPWFHKHFKVGDRISFTNHDG